MEVLMVVEVTVLVIKVDPDRFFLSIEFKGTFTHFPAKSTFFIASNG